ncbi:MAG: 3-hydroxyacyl-CoA dehydrogenase family protein, partial [Myxococcales bacterium]|nr:3-hydroxyacyl-CoA dehydrogenase family protein [Myxococcales bacterium]
IGAGTMGADLAFDLAAHGYAVTLCDIHPAALEAAKARMAELRRLVLFMARDRFGGLDLDGLGDRIRYTTTLVGEGVDFVIENIIEDIDAKRALYQELGGLVREDVVLAVNTSCISITKVGSWVPAPERVIGMHLLNPVPLKRLVEVIVGRRTSEQTLARAQALLASLDKSAVVVRDSPGFVTNRILMLTINEAAWVVQDQIADPASVDRIFTEGFSHKMGPLATGDLIGLDTILHSLEVLHESFGDPKFRPCPLLVRMVDAGELGRKSGKGFFDYRR